MATNDKGELIGGQIQAFDGERYEWFPNDRPLPKGWYTGPEAYEEANGLFGESETEAGPEPAEEPQAEMETEPVEAETEKPKRGRPKKNAE